MELVIGERYSTKFRIAHRIDAIIVALEPDYVVADCFHRCEPFCWLLREFARTLKLDGPGVRYYIADFLDSFLMMAPREAIALTGGFE